MFMVSLLFFSPVGGGRGDTVDINKRYLSSIYAKRLDRVNENKLRRSVQRSFRMKMKTLEK